MESFANLHKYKYFKIKMIELIVEILFKLRVYSKSQWYIMFLQITERLEGNNSIYLIHKAIFFCRNVIINNTILNF